MSVSDSYNILVNIQIMFRFMKINSAILMNIDS